MIKFLDLQKINRSFGTELQDAVSRVVDSGWYVRGEEVQRFEEAYALYTGVAHCVGTGNGFDALRLIFRGWIALGVMREGDEVIVPANTYIASLLPVSENRLRPVLVEPDPRTFTIDPSRIAEKITTRTRAIMVVHLYGRNGMHRDIRELAKRHGLKIVEDNAQAAGCRFGAKRTGSLGDAAAHSFFPTKNLGCLGDGGAVTTDDGELARAIRTLANYGAAARNINHLKGVNSRLDEVQAAVLRVKLARLDADNRRRSEVAEFYRNHIRHPHINLPEPAPEGEHVWHLFVVRSSRREELRQYLHDRGIETHIHYPIPPHKQDAYCEWNNLDLPLTEQIHREVLSLPVSPVLTEGERQRIVETINGFE